MVIRCFGILLILSLAAISSCKSGTEPGMNYKSPMEMTWTVDTLYYPGSIQTEMYNLLGLNNKDIYAYGHCDDNRGKLYHFNGTKWEVYDITPYIYGCNVFKMLAFRSDNIIGVGTRGANSKCVVFNYNGLSWTYDMNAEYIPGALNSVAANSPNNIYACGTNGIIYSYDGHYWVKENINIKTPANTSMNFISIAVYNNEVWAIMDARNNSDYFRSFLIKGVRNNWVIMDSINTNASPIIANRGLFRVFLGENKKLYSSGTRGFYAWNGGQWNLLYNDLDNYHLFVLNDNYIISFGGLNTPKFYNGNSWSNFYSFLPGHDDVEFKDAWSDGKEIFLIGLTINKFPAKTIIYHGK